MAMTASVSLAGAERQLRGTNKPIVTPPPQALAACGIDFLKGTLASKLNRNPQPACIPSSTAHIEGSFYQGGLIR